MLSRTLVASVLPRTGRLRPARPSWRTLMVRLSDTRQRSLRIQERAAVHRARSSQTYLRGRRS